MAVTEVGASDWTLWELRAKEAPEHNKENWPGSTWFVELITTKTIRKGSSRARHLFCFIAAHLSVRHEPAHSP